MPIAQKTISSATSGTVTCVDSQQDQLLVLSVNLIATLTIAMPATPVDGQRVFIKAKAGVTLLTITASGATTFLQTLTSLGSTQINFTYDALSNKWV